MTPAGPEPELSCQETKSEKERRKVKKKKKKRSKRNEYNMEWLESVLSQAPENIANVLGITFAFDSAAFAA